jgi:hypothetical protein
LLCLLAFSWRVAGLASQSLWRDEVDSIRFASRPLAELLATFSRPGENGPLFFALLNPWLAALGDSEFALRFQAVLPGVLAVPLTYALARRLLAVVSKGELQLSLRAGGEQRAAASCTARGHQPLSGLVQPGRQDVRLADSADAGALLAFLAALQHGQWWRWLVFLDPADRGRAAPCLGCLVDPDLRRVAAAAMARLPAALATLPADVGDPLVPYFQLVGWWQLRLFTTPDFQTGHPFVPLPQMATNLATAFSQGVAAAPTYGSSAG